MSTVQEVKRDRFRGALVGTAVGDALGAPFEGAPPLAPGELETVTADDRQLSYTDDTAMTIGVATSLLARGGFDGAHLAETFVEAYRQEPWRGYGAGPPRIFARIERGEPWDRPATELFGGSGSYGNGAAMRVAPAALAAHPDLDAVARLAAQTASVTHTHPIGIDGAVAQACAVSALIGWEIDVPVEAAALTERVRPFVATAEFEHALDAVVGLPRGATPQNLIATLGNGIEALRSVPTALYVLLRHVDSFETAVRFAISLGGDADTIGAMTGALGGALLGESAIPSPWRERVEGTAQLRELAERLWDRASDD
ncbi:MAG: ADP-ribosylglycohydrolase family protein [Actinobacteria bacterium]|nr:ADP-ribosylglycohydrolase family protein [Actinomycetota bacterium]